MASRRASPERQPPPVLRLRLRYAKRGPARFASHRDFARVFERALRRAGTPMAFSSGFTPHPRVSYASAAPTGAASEAEYLEIGLSRQADPDEVARALNSVLPAGMVVLAAVHASGPPLGSLLEASRWRIELRGADPALLASAVSSFLAADRVEVSRTTKRGERVFDAREAVKRLDVSSDATLEAVLAHTAPLVRPDDLAAALGTCCPLLRHEAVLPTRLRQGPLDQDTVGDPFESAEFGVGVE